jgi:hypothetical protein
MANQQNRQNPEDQQQQQSQQNQQRATPAQNGADQNSEISRSEDLLPAGAADNSAGSSADGRFEVAEEVSLDIQGDDARRVGHLANVEESMPDTVQTEAEDENKGTP